MRGYKAGKGLKTVYRPPVPLVFFSLIFGFFCFLVFWFFAAPETGGESLAVLTVDENIPDRFAGDLIIGAGFNDFYSESGTKVYMDDFGQWKVFYLDEFAGSVKPFDPRDSGYAVKLRSFFVNENGRHYFIHLGETANYSRVEKTIAGAMGSIPYSMEILGPVNPYLFWFMLQFAAALCALIVSGEKTRFVLFMPVILAFSWAAVPGIILAGILAGFYEMLGQPLKELFSREPYGSFKERFSPYKKTLIWILVLFILYIFLAIILNIHLIPAFTGLLCFIAMIIISFAWKKKAARKSAKSGRGLFSPVIILHFRQKSVIFPKSMAIFAIMALLGTFLLFIPGLSSYFIRTEKKDFPNLPSAAEYYEYMTFQSLFSYLPLGVLTGGYLSYYLGEDGLIAGSVNLQNDFGSEIPVFPLERLVNFLLNYQDNTVDKPDDFLKEWFSVALILLLFIPQFIFLGIMAKDSGKNRKFSLSRANRIAA